MKKKIKDEFVSLEFLKSHFVDKNFERFGQIVNFYLQLFTNQKKRRRWKFLSCFWKTEDVDIEDLIVFGSP